MTARLSSKTVYDEAASWAAKMDAGALSAGEEAALKAWLSADTRHFGAFAQAQALLIPAQERAPMHPAQPVKPRRRVFIVGGSIAAGLAIAAGSATYVGRIWNEGRYRTQVGELRVIPLDDGSIVFLNTNSEILVRYSKARRDIELVRGEALFDVAKNKARPFIVKTGTTQVRAVGTSFSVKVLPGQPVQVLVREGVVEVKRQDVPVAPAILVASNNRALAPLDAPIVAEAVETAEVGRALAWQVGRIAFHGEPLNVAASEFSRYSPVHIQIDDPEVANKKVIGLFVSTDPVGFANAVAVSFDLRADISGDQIRLSRK